MGSGLLFTEAALIQHISSSCSSCRINLIDTCYEQWIAINQQHMPIQHSWQISYDNTLTAQLDHLLGNRSIARQGHSVAPPQHEVNQVLYTQMHEAIATFADLCAAYDMNVQIHVYSHWQQYAQEHSRSSDLIFAADVPKSMMSDLKVMAKTCLCPSADSAMLVFLHNDASTYLELDHRGKVFMHRAQSGAQISRTCEHGQTKGIQDHKN
jgi:hypothetical protein